MKSIPHPDLTALLCQAANGNEDAANEAFLIVHETLNAIARIRVGKYHGDTWTTTDLVAETYVRLFKSKKPIDWENRRHFLGYVAKAMTNIINDAIRKKKAKKIPPPEKRVPLDDIVEFHRDSPWDFERLRKALDDLEEVDPETVEIVRLRFVIGLNTMQIEDATGLHRRKIERRLKAARAFLRKIIEGK